MEPLVNDGWRGAFTTAELGRYRYTVLAWVDRFATWRTTSKAVEAGQDLTTDLLIGARLVEAAAGRATGVDAGADAILAADHPGRRQRRPRPPRSRPSWPTSCTATPSGVSPPPSSPS